MSGHMCLQRQKLQQDLSLGIQTRSWVAFVGLWDGCRRKDYCSGLGLLAAYMLGLLSGIGLLVGC